MVMRNRNDGSDAYRRDRLPPHLQARFSQPVLRDASAATEERAEPAAPFSRAELIGDLMRLAAAFVLVACGIILFLLVAVSFVYG